MICKKIIKVLVENQTNNFCKKEITLHVLKQVESVQFKYPPKNKIDREFVVKILEDCGGYKYIKNRYTIDNKELKINSIGLKIRKERKKDKYNITEI